jgi:PAS domain S-box-containing protein
MGLYLGGCVAGMGLLRIILYGWGAQHTFDLWLFSAKLGNNPMAFLTAFEFSLSGTALALLDRQTHNSKRPAQYLSLTVASMTLLTIVGHLYGVESLIQNISWYQPMSLNVSLCFLGLSLGILCSRPEKDLMRVICSESVGGITARRLLPAAILIPILLGYLRLMGERAGLFGIALSAASFAISTLIISTSLIWWVALHLHHLDKERQLADAETRQSRVFLESVIENIPDMIFIKDAKDLRFVRLNKAGEELLGHSQDEVLGKNDCDFFPKEQADFFTSKDRQVLDNKVLIDISEEPIETSKGRRILHTKKIPILDAQGNAKYLLGISEDVTARKLAEEELYQGKKLQAVGLLAAGVAHQINNPIAVILGFAQYLRNHVAEGDRLYEAVRSIERESLRCRTLIQDLLAFSRKKGTRVIAVKPIVVLNSALSLIDSQALIKKVHLVRYIPDDLPEFEVDPQQIQEVIINLCLNAIDAMPAGGTLTLQAAWKDDTGTGMGEIIELRVVDTGQGIPENIRQRIFEPFFTTKAVGEGTGLGLSLSYGIVKAHRGQIDIESEVGRGTTFIVRLPLHAHKVGSMDIQSSAA